MPDTATEEVTTASVLQDMLTENTGRHLLDSGGAYGRNWEKNQGRSFADEPPATLTWKYGGGVTLSLFHFLNDRLSYEAEADAAYRAWADAREGTYDLQDMEEWVEEIGAAGLYGDGPPNTVNTYNGEDALSQTIQYVHFTVEEPTRLPGVTANCVYCEKPIGWNADYGWATDDVDEVGEAAASCAGTGSGGEHEEDEGVYLTSGTYVLLQIHGGCDVRGGYTRPRLFSLYGYEETALFDNARAELYCDLDSCQDSWGSRTRWTTDNAGYSWDSDSGTPLGDYETVEVANEELPPPAERVGKLYIDTDEDKGYCPVCGEGVLLPAPP